MPILIIYVEKFFLTNQLRFFFGISLIISSIILSGGIELLIYSSILLVIYLAFTIYKFRRVINLFQFKFFFKINFIICKFVTY